MVGIDKLYIVDFKNRGINYFSKCYLIVLIFFLLIIVFFIWRVIIFWYVVINCYKLKKLMSIVYVWVEKDIDIYNYVW